MEDEIGRPTAAAGASRSRPSRAVEREDVVVGERARERVAELAARARDQDAASRGERIGFVVLHRCVTRGSFQGMPCSSGSPGSYSSVTW